MLVRTVPDCRDEYVLAPPSRRPRFSIDVRLDITSGIFPPYGINDGADFIHKDIDYIRLLAVLVATFDVDSAMSVDDDV